MGFAHQNKHNEAIEVWLGQSDAKIKGIEWPHKSDGTKPLTHLETPHSDYVIHLQERMIKLSGKDAYLTLSQSHMLQTISLKKLDQPLSFDEGKKKTLEFVSGIDFFNSNFKQAIKNRKPGSLPANNGSKTKLRMRKRKTYAIASIDQKFEIILGLEEESSDQWQINFSIKQISEKK